MASEHEPAYRRIAEGLRRSIEEGRIARGGRLASERELAEQNSVSLMTARRALVELERWGLVTRRVGSGTFVAPALGGVRQLRDPGAEFHASECVVRADGIREWQDAAGVVVVTEQVTLTEEGALGARPLLEYLGDSAVHAAEEIWAEGDVLHVRQTIYGSAQEVLAVREMAVRGRKVEGWVRR